MNELSPGTQIGPYVVVRQLGAGGMGAVYEVEHTTLGVRYALKTYTLADEHADYFRRRFLTEGKILARLRHPNLVRVFDLEYDEASGFAYYVMDLVVYGDGEARPTDLISLSTRLMAKTVEKRRSWKKPIAIAAISTGAVAAAIALAALKGGNDGDTGLDDEVLNEAFAVPDVMM